MVDLEEKKLLKMKLRGTGLLIIFCVVGFLLIQHLISNFVCDFNQNQYEGSGMFKSGITLDEALKTCKNYKEQFYYISFTIFIIPALVVIMFFVVMPRQDKENKKWFVSQNGKCGRCMSTISYLTCWWDTDNKRAVCERCGKTLELDKEDREKRKH